MTSDDALTALDAKMRNFEDVSADLAALIARARGPNEELHIHGRLAEIFGAHCEFDEARAHACRTVAAAAAARTGEDLRLLTLALELQMEGELLGESLAPSIDDLRRLAEVGERLSADEARPLLIRVRGILVKRLEPGAESEAHARALVNLLEEDHDEKAMAAAELSLARILSSRGERREARGLVERIIARDLPESWTRLDAHRMLAELQRSSGEDPTTALKHIEAIARVLDDVREPCGPDVWTFLFTGDSASALAGTYRVSEFVRQASWGHVDDPVTVTPEGQPTLGGLFSERTFGPLRDFACACGAESGVERYFVICKVCDVQVLTSGPRQWRFGSIALAHRIVNPRHVGAVARKLGISRVDVLRIASGGDRDLLDEELRDAADEFARLDGATFDALPVPSPEGETSPMRVPAVRAAYEAILEANGKDPTALQAAVDGLFATLGASENPLDFFNALSGVLDIQMSKPATAFSERIMNRVAPSNACITSVGCRWRVAEGGGLRELTPEEWGRMVLGVPSVKMRSRSGVVVEHIATRADGFDVRDLARAVVETERRGRERADWFDAVDVHHVFFEGVQRDENDVWTLRWGS